MPSFYDNIVIKSIRYTALKCTYLKNISFDSLNLKMMKYFKEI